MPSSSLKKLGKRPASVGATDGLETTQPPQSAASTPIQQKRVLPSRSRRGGPGIGNCSVDLLIMDTERRTRDSKPVIPPTQAFFLTTYSKAVPPPPQAAQDGEAGGSYFDKPEVKAAYLAARAIQVPEFSPLPDDAVGGRLRARAEEEGPETSDEAYILRHRKYETFEKRQRRREKEKLVHERYKLKERIEQLRGMDTAAFGVGGEARRKDMLGVAEDLEMRYAVLLPPEPRRGAQRDERRKKDDGQRAEIREDEDSVDQQMDGVDAEGSAAGDTRQPGATGSRATKARRMSGRMDTESPIPTRMPAISVALSSEPVEHTSVTPLPSSRVTNRKRRRSAFTEPPSVSPPSSPRASATPMPDTLTVPRPRKRQRIDRRFRTPDAGAIGSSVLLQIAARKAAQPQARQTSRTILAFGFRVPREVEEELVFALPDWVITQEELEKIHETRGQSATSDGNPPNPSGHIPNGKQPADRAETKDTGWQKEMPGDRERYNNVDAGLKTARPPTSSVKRGEKRSLAGDVGSTSPSRGQKEHEMDAA